MSGSSSSCSLYGSGGLVPKPEIKKWPCPDCGKKIHPTNFDMNRHRKTHTDRSTWEFQCNWAGCTFVCTQKGGFAAHMRSKHTREMLPPCGMPACSEYGEALGPCKYACPDASSMTRHRQRVHGVPRPRAGRSEEVPQAIEVPQSWIPAPMTPAFDLTDSTPPTPRMMPIFWYLPERARYRHYPSPDEDGDYGMDLGVKSDVPRLTRDVDWSESLSS